MRRRIVDLGFLVTAALVVIVFSGAAQEFLDFGRVPVGMTEVRSTSITLPPGWGYIRVDGPATEAFAIEDIQTRQVEEGELGPQVTVTVEVSFAPLEEGTYNDFINLWAAPADDPELAESWKIELHGEGISQPGEEGEYEGSGPDGGSVYRFEFTAGIKGVLIPPVYDCETGERIQDVQVDLVPKPGAEAPYDPDEVEKIYISAEGYYPLVIEDFSTMQFNVGFGFFTIQATYLIPGAVWGPGLCLDPGIPKIPKKKCVTKVVFKLDGSIKGEAGKDVAVVQRLQLKIVPFRPLGQALQERGLWVETGKNKKLSLPCVDAFAFSSKEYGTLHYVVTLQFPPNKKEQFKELTCSVQGGKTLSAAELERRANERKYKRKVGGIVNKTFRYTFDPESSKEPITLDLNLNFTVLNCKSNTDIEDALNEKKLPKELEDALSEKGFDLQNAEVKVERKDSQWKVTIPGFELTLTLVKPGIGGDKINVKASTTIKIQILEFVVEERKVGRRKGK